MGVFFDNIVSEYYVYIILLLFIWNLLTFFLMGLDKFKSRNGYWRVRESSLLLCAFFMGGLGCWLGSFVFRHKSRKTKFRILLPLAWIFNLAVICFFIWYFLSI